MRGTKQADMPVLAFSLGIQLFAAAAAASSSLPQPQPQPQPHFVGVTCETAPFSSRRYCNHSVPVPERVAALVEWMTPTEKIGLLTSYTFEVPRLGIPYIQFGEGLHGVESNCGAAVGLPDQFGERTGCATSYASAIAGGATFNRSLWVAVGAADGREGRALHNQPDPDPKNFPKGLAGLAFWAPNINLFRDPRWGRGQEVPGEDPTLTSEYVTHFANGLQHGDTGGDDDGRYLQILSTCKHFLGYDIETGREALSVDIPTRMLVEYYLPVFKACVETAKTKSIMCSYNAIGGVPSCANSKFNNDLVRGEWGWDGFFVSDCNALTDFLPPKHNFSQTPVEAVVAALKGGTDLECDHLFKEHGAAALAAGNITMEEIDTSISRTLAHVFALGALDGPDDVVYQSYGPEMVDTTEHRLLSLSVAEQAMTLLKNDPPSRSGSSSDSNERVLLPLKHTERIAFLGAHANYTTEMLSNYHGQNTLVFNFSTVMAAQRLGLNFIYRPGVNTMNITNTSTSFIPAAVAAAKSADVAVVVAGLNQECESEQIDRGPGGRGCPTLGLPGAQQALLEAVVDANPRTVLVLINGGMLSTRWAKENVPAILEAYYPGQLGGLAIVNTLLGKNNPGGKTPTTWYDDSILKRDIHDMDLMSGEGLTHLYYKGEPLWPFGWGRSYTSFSYAWDSGAVALASEVTTDKAARGDIQYACTVKNTGPVSGDAVVLGFVNSTDPQFPRQRLFGFERVTLMVGESKTVLLTVDAKHLGIVDSKGRRWLNTGSFTVAVGDVIAPTSHTFMVTEGSGVAPVLLEDYSSVL